MNAQRRRRTIGVGSAALALVVTASVVAGTGSAESLVEKVPMLSGWAEHEAALPYGPREKAEGIAGDGRGEEGNESAEAATLAEQFDQHRFSGGIVAPGAYTAAANQIASLPKTAGTWSEVTKLAYDADDPHYRDYYSNSSGGAGLVTGRITGLTADSAGDVYAGGADGGVYRSTTGGGNWTPIGDQLHSLSTGDLQLDQQGRLWYATGEGNTGATSFVGDGVWIAGDPRAASVSWQRVGGTELDSTVLQHLRFGGGKAWVGTSRGIFVHSLSGELSTPWQQVFAPNPDYLPGGSKASDPSAPYKNIVNDVAVDPRNASHVIAAVGWRGGDTYNGFYETRNAGATWAKVNLQGGIDAIDPTDIGNTTFGFSADGSKLYAVVQSIKAYSKTTGNVNSYLKGVYVSNSGTVSGPWTRIADSQKLGNSGSALKQTVGGKGYGPGIQAWYNQFVAVDPADAKHVYVGLEEVYETRDGGATWKTVGPYWNFYFSCWNASNTSAFAGCKQTTHSDQHSIAFGSRDGRPFVFVGNDGGAYARPVQGTEDAAGHATDWVSLNDGTIDALQYYAVGIGKDGNGVAVSGGLQDNGGSILRAGAAKMSSNFGGDGGDVLVDPNNGCNIVQEYVYLAMRVTQNCATSTSPEAFIDPSKATTYDIAPPDNATAQARFIAPFDADRTDVSKWIAGGRHVWTQGKGFAIRSGSEWHSAFDLGAGHAATAVAMREGKAVVAWCGTCNNAGFARGIAVGTYGDDASWHQAKAEGLPVRYVGGVTVAPNGDLYAAVGGFSRRFTEGPGAGYGHVFVSRDNGDTWTSVDGSGATAFPDVPANSVKVLADGALVVGTDLGTMYRAAGSSSWQVLGNGLPATTVMDVEAYGSDLYVATHGRGIWKIATPAA